MQVNRIDSPTNFKSKFIPNSVLGQSFDRAAKEQDRLFVKAVKAILNDGKEDTLELQKRNPHYINLYVNDEIAEEGHIFSTLYGNVGSDLIKKYANRLSHTNRDAGKYNILSEQEKEFLKEDVSLIKLLSENFESGTNFIDNIQKVLDDMKQKLDNNTKKEVLELKNLIFNK